MPFVKVTDYPSMLRRIAAGTLVVSAAVFFALYYEVPPVAVALSRATVKIPNVDFSVPAGVIAAAVVVTVAARWMKLHDRISDIFGIRHRFDVCEILLPMAAAAAVPLSVEQQDRVSARRESLMSAVFYKYASSTAREPAIDRHAIIMALDQWSWYWMAVEAIALLIAGAAVSAYFGVTGLASVFLALVLGVMLILKASRTQSVRYARRQIALILDDDDRREAVARVFRAV